VRDDFSGNRQATAMRWGLIPSWAKDTSSSARMINARSETVHEKPAFRHAIRARRCIIPAHGYFEWSKNGSTKVPHYISLKNGSPLSFAGIREVWKSPAGETVESFSILTTQANSFLEQIHDRMPVILHLAEHQLWLDRTVNDPLDLQRLYQPYPSELLQEWTVTNLVNSPRNDGPELITPPVQENCLFMSTGQLKFTQERGK
jgi:putative SOS response-associated peptidase YedK